MPAAVLHEVLSAATARLREAGFGASDAAGDVAVLARHLLGWDRGRLLAHRLDAAPAGFAAALDALVAQRLDRVPVAYLTGTREFYGLDFAVTPDVLIPRPETELAVEAVLGVAPATGACVVDVGTGSGAIAVAIAVTRRDVRVVAIDRSRAALAVARRNVVRHGVGGRVALVAGDLLTAVAAKPGRIEVVVSNPPYVPDDSADVAPDVRRHEPPQALYAGPDGLDVLRRLVAASAAVLSPGGHLIMEIGAGQADDVAALARAAGGWTPARFCRDLQEIARVAVLARAATGA
jgi:release factor glutamine methyltransferase